METSAGAARAPKRIRRDIDGILLLDKPHGLSSNQALQRVKWLYGARKAGHTGSLDPLATGMLPICLGQATKVSAFLLNSDKTYRAQVAFGAQTATGDVEGPVIATGAPTVSADALELALAGFRGAISQTPPMYSALKHDGQRLYELARQGQTVERQPRDLWIHELTVEAYDPYGPILRIRCSKGTYIRTLVEDIARAAGTVAHLAALHRLSVEPFAEAAMRSLPELDSIAPDEAALDALLLPLDSALSGWPAVRLDTADAARISHGQTVVARAEHTAGGAVRLYDPAGRFLGIGDLGADRRITARRLMATGAPQLESEP